MRNLLKIIISALQTWTNKRIKSNTPDWNQNDSNGDGYIKNRPFYTDGDEVVQIDKKYLPDATSFVPEGALRPDYEIYDETQVGYIKNRPCYYKPMLEYNATEEKSFGGTSSTYWRINNTVDFMPNCTYRVSGAIEYTHSDYPSTTFEQSFDFNASYGYVAYHWQGINFGNNMKFYAPNNHYLRFDGICDGSSDGNGCICAFVATGVGSGSRTFTVKKFILNIEILKQLDEHVIPDTIARVEQIPLIDTTLSIEGAAADAKVVGEELAKRPTTTEVNQQLITNTDGVTTWESRSAFKMVEYIGDDGLVETGWIEPTSDVTEIVASEFYRQELPSDIYYPNVETIDNYAFRQATGVKRAIFPKVTTLGSGVFRQCNSLEYIYMPLLETLKYSTFQQCTNLKTILLPKVKKLIYGSEFDNCTALQSICMPALIELQAPAFSNCKSLITMDFPKLRTLIWRAIDSTNVGLQALILRSKTMCVLDRTFRTGNPIEAGTCYIYVPSALVETYKTDAVWSNYASQIRAIEDYMDICGENPDEFSVKMTDAIDAMLTVMGAPADAKATGDAINAVDAKLDNLIEERIDNLIEKEEALIQIAKPKDYIALIDQVNGYTYLVSMRNGSLVSEAGVQSIQVTTMPTNIETEYTHGEYIDTTGMVITATCFDGTTRDITDEVQVGYVKENVGAEVTYIQAGVAITTVVPVTVIAFDAETILVDFEYTDNGDDTYTITGWKGTYNGETSTEMIVPNYGCIIV